MTQIKTIKEAVNRLQWRFSQGKPFTPNKTDVEALNAMTNGLSWSAHNSVVSNEVLSKLYVILLREYVYKYRDIMTASDMLRSDLKAHSLSGRMQLLQAELNYAATDEFFAKLNLHNVEWETGKNINDIAANRIKNREIFKGVNMQQASEAMTAWDYETVEETIKAEILTLVTDKTK